MCTHSKWANEQTQKGNIFLLLFFSFVCFSKHTSPPWSSIGLVHAWFSVCPLTPKVPPVLKGVTCRMDFKHTPTDTSPLPVTPRYMHVRLGAWSKPIIWETRLKKENIYSKYSNVHLCFPGLILSYFPLLFWLTKHSPSLRKTSRSNPRPIFSNCMRNNVTSVHHCLTSFIKKQLYTTRSVFKYSGALQNRTLKHFEYKCSVLEPPLFTKHLFWSRNFSYNQKLNALFWITYLYCLPPMLGGQDEHLYPRQEQ